MSTIEKALQKQREAALKKQQEQAAADSAQQTPETTENTLERAAQQAVPVPPKAEAQVPPSAPVTETQTVTTGKARSDASRDRYIDLVKVQQEGFVNREGRSLINEEYRAIKRKVLNNAFGPLSKTLNNSNLIMVTSPNPNEGKTFTAINLALSIALEQDKTVLLVDADVLRPSVMKTIDQPFENGLMEYLLGEVDDVGEIMHHTSLDTLKIIPAGKSHHLSTELLASEKMSETVQEFANRYSDRVVIFDTPPLIGINETAVMANLAGQAVIVVQEGKTSMTRLSQAVDQLNPDMAKGFVLNKSLRKEGSGAGYYGYYYGSSD